MREIITSYLDNNYEITLKTYVNYMLNEKTSNTSAFMQDIKAEVSEIYDMTDMEFDLIWDSWLATKIVEFENKVTDIQFLIYEKTGIEINLDNPKWTDLMDDNTEKYIRELLESKE